MRVLGVRAFSVQYHPEAGPGPHDAKYLFAVFDELMGGTRGDPVRSERAIVPELGVA
jgi:carbamoyl-phosphate synthase small subunit